MIGWLGGIDPIGAASLVPGRARRKGRKRPGRTTGFELGEETRQRLTVRTSAIPTLILRAHEGFGQLCHDQTGGHHRIAERCIDIEIAATGIEAAPV